MFDPALSISAENSKRLLEAIQAARSFDLEPRYDYDFLESLFSEDVSIEREADRFRVIIRKSYSDDGKSTLHLISEPQNDTTTFKRWLQNGELSFSFSEPVSTDELADIITAMDSALKDGKFSEIDQLFKEFTRATIPTVIIVAAVRNCYHFRQEIHSYDALMSAAKHQLEDEGHDIYRVLKGLV